MFFSLFSLVFLAAGCVLPVTPGDVVCVYCSVGLLHVGRFGPFALPPTAADTAHLAISEQVCRGLLLILCLWICFALDLIPLVLCLCCGAVADRWWLFLVFGLFLVDMAFSRSRVRQAWHGVFHLEVLLRNTFRLTRR